MELLAAHITNQILDKYFVTSLNGRPALTINNRVQAMLDDRESVRIFIGRFYGPSLDDAEVEQIIDEVMV